MTIRLVSGYDLQRAFNPTPLSIEELTENAKNARLVSEAAAAAEKEANDALEKRLTEVATLKASTEKETKDGLSEEEILQARLDEIRRIKTLRAELAKEEAELEENDTGVTGNVTKTISAESLTISQAPLKTGATNGNKPATNKVAGK